jgi:hypothetical protein
MTISEFAGWELAIGRTAMILKAKQATSALQDFAKPSDHLWSTTRPNSSEVNSARSGENRFGSLICMRQKDPSYRSRFAQFA